MTMNPSDGAAAPRPSSLLPGYPITTLIPRNSLNMLCGGPFSGKTKVLQTALSQYLLDGSLFGSRAPVDPDTETPMLARLGWLACVEGQEAPTLPSACPALLRRRYLHHDGLHPTIESLYENFPSPRPQLLIVDGLQLMMPGGKVSDPCEIATWCAHLTNWCESEDVTIIGTANAPKTKPGEPAYALQDRIAYSIQWASCMQTLLVLDWADQRDPVELAQLGAERSSTRILTALAHCRRPTPPQYYDFDSDDRLVNTLAPCLAMSTERGQREALATIIAAQGSDPVRTAQILESGASVGMSKATVERWLLEAMIDRRIEKLSKGVYRWLGESRESD